jgi:hypothetical protein
MTASPEEDAAREPRFYVQSPAGRWNATAPILAGERQAETAGGVVPQHTGEEFTAQALYVHGVYGTRAPQWQVYGPNIRADGSPGRYTLRRAVTRDYAITVYPDAAAALFAALSELAVTIRADAEEATAEIRVALTGEQEQGS